MRVLTLAAAVFLLLTVLSWADDIVPWTPDGRGAGTAYFDQEHDESFAYDAYAELAGKSMPQDSTRAAFAKAVLAELDKLPRYGMKETANIKPQIPEWFLTGYRRFQPTTVARSRYLDGVIAGTLPADSDRAGLYAFWCAYDAEWFSLSRKADYKAWLSAVLLTYAPKWLELGPETEANLHARLVSPLQTKDEPFRELDNWIKAFTRLDGAFAKPKVRDALVDELLAKGGLAADGRMFEDEAYGGPTPASLGLSQRQFFLLAALVLEYYQELYEASPATKQPLYFRDYFLGVFNSLR